MTKQHHTGMVLIAGFKVVKGLLLLLVGLGFLRLVHAETATLFSKLLEALHLNAESHILHALVLQVDALRPESILTLGAMSMLYAGLLLTEGLGLWFERSWAAAVVHTASKIRKDRTAITVYLGRRAPSSWQVDD